MIHRLAKFLLLPIALLALGAPAASAAPKSAGATSGQVSASVNWDETDRRGTRDVRVSITRAGTQLVSEEVQPRCEEFCWTPPGDEPVRVRDVSGDAEPEVLVDLYTGGAHCCSILQVYRFDAATGRYARVRRDFGNAGYTLRDPAGGGQAEFFTGDDRFSYLYTSYLESARPLVVLRFDGGRFVDDTRRYPVELRRHARSLYRFYKRLRRDPDLDLRGVLAAWQADNYAIGRGSAARGWKTLRAAAKRGELRARGANRGPSGKRYLRSLRRNLKRFGYIR